jgi:acetyl-CoA decarbonylase/synthase complex subunit gamma
LKETSPLNLYKQLPQSNCKKCGEETCMAFAAGLIARTRKVEECTPLFEDKKYAKKLGTLQTTIAPEVALVYIGVGDKQVKVGARTSCTATR